MKKIRQFKLLSLKRWREREKEVIQRQQLEDHRKYLKDLKYKEVDLLQNICNAQQEQH